MKKNKMMRLASSLLVAVLLTSSVISGTFAKYVTDADGSDSARVAKWGVTATVTGEAFKKEYAKTDTHYSVSANTVVSTEKVIAPGTDGTFGGVTLSGTPEVAVRVSYTSNTKVDLAGEWTNGTEFYCPLQFNINGTPIDGRTYTSETDLETDLYNAIVKGAADYQPGTDLSTIDSLNGTYTWKWDFEGEVGSRQNDVDDTYLGDWDKDGREKPEITITVEVVVEQID